MLKSYRNGMSVRIEEKQERLLKALIEIGQELASTVELEDLLHRILRASRDVFHFENSIIRLLDESDGVLRSAASYGFSEDAVRRDLRLGEGVMGKVAQTGTAILVSDLSDHPDYVTGISGARSELAVPLLARDRVIGVFNVESPRPNAFSVEDREFLIILARQAATAIENARLYESLRSISGQYRDLHQFNSNILRSVNLGIYTVDAQMHITSWNPKMEEFSGIGEAEALGRPLLTLFPKLESEGIAKRIRRVLSRGTPEKVRLAHRDFRGDLRFQRRRIAPLKDGQATNGAVVIVEDITEFKRLLDQTIQSEKLAELGRLSAGIAHEINNPLAVVSYACQLLLREEGLKPFEQELLERIESETERLKTLTGGLLSFSKARETVRRFTDLNDIVRDVVRLVHYELVRKGIDLKENYAELPLVQVDPNKLKQVIINLVMNAAQALKKNGTIELSSRAVDDTRVELTIKDDGPGIPAEVRKKIFEPFFTTKKEGEGTGLGLYICRNIINDHNGRLLLDTAPGKGTAFRIELPVSRVHKE